MRYYLLLTTLACLLGKLQLSAQALTVSGRVLTENGDPIAGATITAKQSRQTVAVTNEKGEFRFSANGSFIVLIITSIGYKPAESPADGKALLAIVLSRKTNELDEVIMQAYGKTTRRLNTGNIAKVTAEEISRQPVTNPLAALQGRVPGLIVSQTSGVPGSSFNVQVRGRSSLDLSLSRNDPLFIIDGVPFESGNLPVNQTTSAANTPTSISEGGLSPLANINPADIESIEVLKDADATSIYGSRGANGVILVTTKKGPVGKMLVNINYYTGWSNVANAMPMLNTQQYLQMRREAFVNDGITPAVNNAPDLLLWDTTRYTDFTRMLIGGTARVNTLQASVSGGTSFNRFMLATGYHQEGNVFPGDLSLRRINVQFSTQHQSADKRLLILLSGNFSGTRNNLLRTDLTRFINLPPHLLLKDSIGNIAWSEKGSIFPLHITNPLSEFQKQYRSATENLNASLVTEYRISPALLVRSSFGYGNFRTDELSVSPKSSIPSWSSTGASSVFAGSRLYNWMAEPHLEYKTKLLGGTINILAGASMQERKQESQYLQGSNYINDLLLGSIRAAGTITASNQAETYRYAAFFGRFSFNRDNKYLLNLSGRRDGSSRFGPHRQFTNFGAIGSGWIFSEEKFFQRHLPFFSFGKLRLSYGVTGNDQIGNYKFLDLWTNTNTSYQGQPGLYPQALFNPEYNWETNRKLEAGLELGLWQDKLTTSVSWFRNRSDNQLVNYRLPAQTGFIGIVRNLPALVQNNGVEIAFSARVAAKESLEWRWYANITLPRNKLLRFPGLASSSYATSYKEGLPLSSYFVFRFTGVDPQTGLYSAADLDSNGAYNNNDRSFLGNTDPLYFGGLGQDLRVKNIEFSFFFDIRGQKGRSYQSIIGSTTPGQIHNQPSLVLDRWQHPGDHRSIQKFTTTSVASSRLSNSDGIYTDASFARLKNVSVAWVFPATSCRKLKITSSRFYIQGQNLLLITAYKGADPETQNFYVLPPLRTITAGIQITF